MSFANQKNAWRAGIISAIVAVLSLSVAAIVNRDKLASFFATFSLAGIWAFCGNSWHDFTGWLSKGIPIWAVLIAIAVLLGIRWVWRTVANYAESNNPTTLNKPLVISRKLSLEDFRVEDYTEDLIDGVWWQWTYSGNTVNRPRPICPDRECQCDLSFREDWMRVNDGPNVARIAPPPVSLFCPRCNFRMDFNKVEAGVVHDVTQEILSQIRTKRFRGRLYNRAMNQQATARQN